MVAAARLFLCDEIIMGATHDGPLAWQDYQQFSVRAKLGHAFSVILGLIFTPKLAQEFG